MRSRYFKANTKSHDIIRLWREGVTTLAEIARRVDCSVPNVAKTVRRHVPEYVPRPRRKRLIIEAPPDEQVSWLQDEARKTGVSVGVMACAMLVDAIEDAKQKS